MQLPKFSSKKEELAYIVANKAAIMDMKKAATKTSDAFSVPIVSGPVNKAAGDSSDTDNAIKRSIVGNTYNWMDSHDDVHLPGVFSKSISERKPWHLHDHVMQIMAKVGTPQGVSEKYLDWSALGINKTGQTQALVMETLIERKLNQNIFDAYRSGEIDQHSVGMRYVKLALAVNDEEYKEAFAVWSSVYPNLGNPERADEKGYFWAVQEAKLIEISCVLEGSNSLTPTLEAGKSTANEPAEATPAQPRKSMFSKLGAQLHN